MCSVDESYQVGDRVKFVNNIREEHVGVVIKVGQTTVRLVQTTGCFDKTFWVPIKSIKEKVVGA